MPQEAVIASVTGLPATTRIDFVSGSAPSSNPNVAGTYTVPFLDGYTELYGYIRIAGVPSVQLTISFSNAAAGPFVAHPDFSAVAVGPNASLLIPAMPVAPNLPRPVYVSGRVITATIVLSGVVGLTGFNFYLAARRT